MKTNDVLVILKLFTGWRVALFLIALLASIFIPWGAMFPYAENSLAISGLPNWIWSFGNFDGVHYLKIAQEGYLANYSQAFFPLYPLLISVLNFFPKNLLLDTRVFVDPSFFYTGILVSNIFFFFALVFLYKLFSLDWDKKTVIRSMFLLLCFPTSYYFGSIYTESLFLFAVVGSLYFARKENFLLAGVFALLGSATKIVGVVLLPVLLIELFQSQTFKVNNPSKKIAGLIGVFLTPLGLLAYMIFLKLNFNNMFYFVTAQPSFGASRSALPTILLPQVIFRYFKIFLNVPLLSSSFFNAFTEFVSALVPLGALFIFFKRIRLSYWVFTFSVLIIPTMTGTFLSMPRFALMSFLLFPYIVKSKFYFVILMVFLALLIILTSLFTRGYWIA